MWVWLHNCQISKCLTREGRPEEGLTDATIWAARRSVGSDQGYSAGARGPCWRRGARTIGCSLKPFCLDFAPASPWRDLPERFGDWKIVYQRFNRWAKSGVFERVFRLLASDHDNEYMMIDATIVRAHRRHAGTQKKTARKPSADPAAD